MHRLLEHLPGQEPSSRAGQTVALRASEAEPVMVLDDSAYGSGEFRAELAERATSTVVKPAPNRRVIPGGFTVDDLTVDHGAGTVTCRNGPLLARARGDENAYRDLAHQYRATATSHGFEGHVAMAATMILSTLAVTISEPSARPYPVRRQVNPPRQSIPVTSRFVCRPMGIQQGCPSPVSEHRQA
jgi:hypothetical protein